MTRSNRKKNHKRVKKLIKKLKDECCHAKKHYEEKINALEMELWNKQYHITSILGYLSSISYIHGTEMYTEASQKCVMVN